MTQYTPHRGYQGKLRPQPPNPYAPYASTPRQAVHNIIAYGSASDVAGVRDEVHALLESCREAADGSMPPAPVPEHELYLQTLFTLLDVLGRWVKDMQDTVGTLRALEAGIARQKQMQRNAQIEPAEVRQTCDQAGRRGTESCDLAGRGGACGGGITAG
eukprot:357433-Chlamydomonas_euryale.AAC.7